MIKILYFFLCGINLIFCTILVKKVDNNVTVARITDLEARFGGEFVDGEMAYLIIAYPKLACNDTIAPPPVSVNGSNIIFVSLIKRGICTFESKVRAAQNSGYQGVIIYNYVNNIFPMTKTDIYNEDPIIIPSCMVGYSDGHNLMKYNYSSYHNQFAVVFFKDFEFNPQFYIIAFLGFVSLGFVLIGIGFAYKLCRDCIKRRANRLKKCHLSKIPIKKFVKGQDLYDTCAICLEDFADGEKLRILPCNHAYHLKCIDPWLLKQKRNCPICKNRIKIPGRDEDSDDNNGVAASESGNVVIDEHTPLINPRNDGPFPSSFSCHENEVNFAPEQVGTLAQNCYDNPCVYGSMGRESSEPKSQILSINGDSEIVQVIVEDETIPRGQPEDLIKIV